MRFPLAVADARCQCAWADRPLPKATTGGHVNDRTPYAGIMIMIVYAECRLPCLDGLRERRGHSF